MKIDPIPTKRIFGIDLIRAFTISLVLLSHCATIFGMHDGVLAQFFGICAYFGVEIFFVLSGFLIGKILIQLFVNKEVVTKKEIIIFLKRRWYRTFPNYFLFLIINILIAIYLNQSIVDLWKYFFFLQNFNDTMHTFFAESWSLPIEEFAYIVLPITLFFAFKKIKKIKKSSLFLYVLLGLISAFILSRCYYNFTTTNTTLLQWNVSLKALVIYRLDSIFIGVVFSWLHIYYTEKWNEFKFLFSFFGVLMFFTQFILVGYFGFLIDKQPFFWNVLYMPITSITIAFFLPLFSNFQTGNTIIKSMITFISKISYSIYLINYSFVLQLLMHFIDTKKYNNFELFLITIFYFFIVIFLSALVYRFYEKPFTDKRELIK